VDHPPQVDPQHPREVVVGRVLDARDAADRGIVDDHVDMAVLLLDSPRERLDRRAIANVNDVCRDLRAACRQLGGLPQTLLVHVTQGEFRALCSECNRQRPADTRRRSRERDDLASEIHQVPPAG